MALNQVKPGDRVALKPGGLAIEYKWREATVERVTVRRIYTTCGSYFDRETGEWKGGYGNRMYRIRPYPTTVWQDQRTVWVNLFCQECGDDIPDGEFANICTSCLAEK